MAIRQCDYCEIHTTCRTHDTAPALQLAAAEVIAQAFRPGTGELYDPESISQELRTALVDLRTVSGRSHGGPVPCGCDISPTCALHGTAVEVQHAAEGVIAAIAAPGLRASYALGAALGKLGQAYERSHGR
jgi:hypothetical protein